MKEGRIKKRKSENSSGLIPLVVMLYDINLLHRHITLAQFPLEKRLVQSGCYSAPPHPLPWISITLCQPSQAAG